MIGGVVLSSFVDRVKSKDFSAQFALWGSAAALTYLVYWHFLGNAANEDRRGLELRLIEVKFIDNFIFTAIVNSLSLSINLWSLSL